LQRRAARRQRGVHHFPSTARIRREVRQQSSIAFQAESQQPPGKHECADPQLPAGAADGAGVIFDRVDAAWTGASLHAKIVKFSLARESRIDYILGQQDHIADSKCRYLVSFHIGDRT